MQHMSRGSREAVMSSLAAARMGVRADRVHGHYDDCHDPSTNPNWAAATAASGSGSALDTPGLDGPYRQARTANVNSSRCLFHSSVIGQWADSRPFYVWHRFRVGTINTLGGGAAPVAGTIMAMGLNDGVDFTGHGIMFGIFGSGSTTNWVVAKQASSAFTYYDTGIAHDLTATTPDVHEAHLWRDVAGNLFFSLDDGGPVSVPLTGQPTAAAGMREIWGAMNGAADANQRAWKVTANYYATKMGA